MKSERKFGLPLIRIKTYEMQHKVIVALGKAFLSMLILLPLDRGSRKEAASLALFVFVFLFFFASSSAAAAGHSAGHFHRPPPTTLTVHTMRAVALVAVLLLAVLAVASAETFYKEQFDSQ